MMQLHGEKVVAAVGVNGDVLAVLDSGRVYLRKWSEGTHEYVWTEQVPVPVRTSAQMGQPVQSVA